MLTVNSLIGHVPLQVQLVQRVLESWDEEVLEARRCGQAREIFPNLNSTGLIAGWQAPLDKGQRGQSPVQIMLLNIPEADHGLPQRPFTSVANYVKLRRNWEVFLRLRGQTG